MDHRDVLIVGGGPAGSTCAWKLRKAGLAPVIIDKKQFPRDKVCAGWVTPAVIDELDIDTADYAQGRVLQPITGFLTSRLGGPQVHTQYDEVVSYGIRRCEFDDYLLKRCGAELRLGESVKSIERDADAWVVNDRIRARLIVGAGGHYCPVARHLGAKVGTGEAPVAAQEIEFEMTDAQQQACPVAPAVPELFFTEDLKGYGWVFRKGAVLNIGLGRQDTHRLSAHVEAFVELLKARGRIPADLPGKFNGHAYLLYDDAPRTLVEDGMLLIGDAAGLAYSQSGEGIRPAIESALMAADTIIGAHGDYAHQNLQPYLQALTARFGERGSRGFDISQLLPAGLRNRVAAWLLGNPWFSRKVVLDRWFLHVHQEPLPSS